MRTALTTAIARHRRALVCITLVVAGVAAPLISATPAMADFEGGGPYVNLVKLQPGVREATVTFDTALMTRQGYPGAPCIDENVDTYLQWWVSGDTSTRQERPIGPVWGQSPVLPTRQTVVVHGLVYGVSYQVRIHASNTCADSTSNVLTLVSTLATQPSPPTNVSATPDDSSVRVSWTPGDDGGANTTAYRVTPYNGGVAQPSTTFDSPSTTQTIAGLQNLQPYTFTVATITAAGTSAESAASAPVTPGRRPTAPTGVTASLVDRTATVNWSAPSSSGDAAVSGFVVTPTQNGTDSTPVAVPASSTSTEFANLPYGSTNTFTVAAVNSYGTGPGGISNAVTPATVPGAPTIGPPTFVVNSGVLQAWVPWTPPSSNGGAPITSYRVTPYVNGSAQPPSPCTGTGCYIDGLSYGTTYRFTVAATNRVGTGVDSGTSAPISKATVPGAPTVGSAVPGDSKVTLSWTAPSFDGYATITGYVVTPYVGITAQPAKTFNSTATSQTISGLSNGTSYTFKVSAKNPEGTGAPSEASAAVTPRGVPGAPTITGVTRGDGFVVLTWLPPASDGGSPIVKYQVAVLVGSVPQSNLEFDASATTRTISGLTNGTTYRFMVRAVNAVGGGAPSEYSASVTPAAVPAAPTLTGASAGDGYVSLTWSPPTSNGGSAITSYVVTPYIGANAQVARTFNSTATSQQITGLTNGTTYTFKVAARNSIGTGTQSATSSAVTPAVPVAPYAPFVSWSAFVNRQYLDLTGKAPSASALSNWVSQLIAGSKTKGDLDDSLRRSTENVTNVDPVVRIYRAFLGRSPDAAGLKFWIARKRNVAPAKTWTVTQIATDFTKSNEFITKYGSLTNRQFVTRIYTDVLGRTADTAGVNYWTGKIDTKAKTKAQVMVGFSESNEYKTKQAQNTDVAIAYIYLLGRAPTASEASDWVARQKSGTTHAALLAELLNSTKYATHISG